MTTFQFDECASWNKYIRNCNAQALSRARRYPTKHKGLKDPDVLAIYMKKNSVFVTTDRQLIDRHEADIPSCNPGLIVIEHSSAILHTLTRRSATKIMDDFKLDFSDWHTVPWSNSMVVITDVGIDIRHKSGKGIVHALHKSFSDVGWQGELKACLVRNATCTELRKG